MAMDIRCITIHGEGAPVLGATSRPHRALSATHSSKSLSVTNPSPSLSSMTP